MFCLHLTHRSCREPTETSSFIYASVVFIYWPPHAEEEYLGRSDVVRKKKCLKELTCSKTTFWTHKVRRTTTELRANHTAGLTCLWWTCVWLSSCRSARLPAQAAPGLLWVCCRSRVRLPLEADTQSWADETLLWMLPRWTPATLCTWADIHTQRIEWNQ